MHLINKTTKRYNMNITITKLNPCVQLSKKYGLLFYSLLVTTISFAQPVNNDCSTATILSSASACTYQIFTLEGATLTPGLPTGGTCALFPVRNVWFKATVPTTGVLVIQGNSSINPIIEITVYSGTCSVLSVYKCSNLLETGKSHLTLKVDSGDLGGQDVYISVTRGSSAIQGSFSLCVYEQQKPVNENIENAILLTNTTGAFQHNTYSGRFAGSTTGLNNGTCGIYVGGDVWFKTMVPASGKMVVHATSTEIFPNIVMYTGSMANPQYKTCAATLNGEAEIILNDINLADEMVYLRVFANNNDKGGSFDMLVLEPTQDVCSEAMVLNGNKATEEFVYYTNKYAATTNDGPIGKDPSCGIYKNTDIWFEVVVPPSGELIIDSKASPAPLYTIKPVLTAYTGSCNNLTEFTCAQLNSSYSFGSKITIVPANNLANQTIYLRMHNFNSSVGGAFRLSVHNPSAPLPVDLVRFSANVLDDEVVLDWATASEENNAYFLVEHSTDGQNFIPVGEVKGHGTTTVLQQYAYIDTDPLYGANYYRLKQVDLDGAFEYSHVVVAQIRLIEDQFKLFPNPSHTSDILTLRWSEDLSKERLVMTITDALGRQIYQQQVFDGGSRETTIRCAEVNMDAGVYFLQLSTDKQVVAHRRLNLVVD
jgi:Secretion system C-terminal sorting domain